MSPLSNIRKSAICLTGPAAHAYNIVQLAEKLPVSFRRHTVPATACAALVLANAQAEYVLATRRSA